MTNTPQLSVSLFDSYSLRSKKSSKRDPHICGLDTLFESGVVKEFISVVYREVVFVSRKGREENGYFLPRHPTI
jgi:hypothetical protein